MAELTHLPWRHGVPGRAPQDDNRGPAAHDGQPVDRPAVLDAGLVDRLRLMTFPLLAGPEGREPFFADTACADLELADHRVLDGRILLAEWVPTGRDIPRD